MYNNISAQPSSPIVIVKERRSHAARFVAILLWLAAGYVMLRMVSSAYVFMNVAPKDADIAPSLPKGLDKAGDQSVASVEGLELEIAPMSRDEIVPSSVEREIEASRTILLEVHVSRQSLMGTMMASTAILVFLALGCIFAFSGILSGLANFLHGLGKEFMAGFRYTVHSIINFDFAGIASSIGHFFVNVYEEAKLLVLVDIPNFFKSLFGLNSANDSFIASPPNMIEISA